MAERAHFLGVLLGCLVASSLGSGIPDRGYVVVDDGYFWLNCRPFVFAGCNSWDLMQNASDPNLIGTVNETLDAMVRMNLTVLRTWAFSALKQKPLLISPGVYDADLFRGLDYVLDQARLRGIRLILALTGYWNSVDGVSKFVGWAGLNNTDAFFTDEAAKGYYENHVKAVLSRVNTFNGRKYSDDPTIFAWNLLSEPRCFSNGCTDAVQNWVEEMSAYVKAVDGNHLVTTGFEGFYSASADHIQYNPGEPSGDWASKTGQDFLKNHMPWSIDFAVAHLWIENWISQQSPEEKVAFVKNWTMIHQQDARSILQKPLVWEEFGMVDLEWSGQSSKMTVFTTIYPMMMESLLNGGAVQGTNFWVFRSPDGQFNYTVQETDAVGEYLAGYANQIASYQQGLGASC